MTWQVIPGTESSLESHGMSVESGCCTACEPSSGCEGSCDAPCAGTSLMPAYASEHANADCRKSGSCPKSQDSGSYPSSNMPGNGDGSGGGNGSFQTRTQSSPSDYRTVVLDKPKDPRRFRTVSQDPDDPYTVGTGGGGGGGGGYGGGGCGDACPDLTCELHVCTHEDSGSAATDSFCNNEKTKKLIEKAFAKREKASEGGAVGMPREYKPEVGPQGAAGQRFWAFAAIFEYTCECNPDPHLEWYRTRQSEARGGRVKFIPDPAVGMEGAIEATTVTERNQEKRGGPPATQGVTKPKRCYIAAVDTPTQRYMGRAGTGWLVVGHVTWKLLGMCPGAYFPECEDMKTVWLHLGKGRPGQSDQARVKDLNKEDVERFRNEGTAPIPW